MAAAQAWYTNFFGSEPYFVRDGYLEWRFGRDEEEFGIINAHYIPGRLEHVPGGQYVYWNADDVQAVVDDLVSPGAAIFEPPTARGEGWVSGAVIDPFGNVLGLIQTRTGGGRSSPHATRTGSRECPTVIMYIIGV